MITFVNGYLCTCSCDVSKAKRGADPHQQADGLQNPESSKNASGGRTFDGPAVLYGGSLGASQVAAPPVAAPVPPTSVLSAGRLLNVVA
jgi:hypothetical protein